jgi:hypothetical protein
MKVVENICCEKIKEITYPRLVTGKVSKIIYLQTAKDKGIVIKNNSNYPSHPIGHVVMTFNPATTEEYKGTITLSND